MTVVIHLTKMFEKVLENKLVNFTSYDIIIIIPNKQYDFKKHVSTEDALSSTLYDLDESSRCICVVIILFTCTYLNKKYQFFFTIFFCVIFNITFYLPRLNS